MDNLKLHIQDLASKLDHTKNLIQTANKLTSEISERSHARGSKKDRKSTGALTARPSLQPKKTSKRRA
jgi:hypothetical protein